MWKAAVVTLSDKGYEGKRRDESGPLLERMLEENGYEVTERLLLPDEKEEIKRCLCTLCDDKIADLIITTGGTGLSPRDCTPEATMEVADKAVPGIGEAMRLASLKITPRAMLSRGVAVIRGRTLIVNLPGSPKAAKENLEAVLPALGHGLGVLTGRDTECAAPIKEMGKDEQPALHAAGDHGVILYDLKGNENANGNGGKPALHAAGDHSAALSDLKENGREDRP